MKKKNFFLAHKQFTFFLILALLIILGAIFAPVVTGGADERFSDGGPGGTQPGAYFWHR